MTHTHTQPGIQTTKIKQEEQQQNKMQPRRMETGKHNSVINPLVILDVTWVEMFIPGLFLSHSGSVEKETLDSCCSLSVTPSEHGRPSVFTPDCAAC